MVGDVERNTTSPVGWAFNLFLPGPALEPRPENHEPFCELVSSYFPAGAWGSYLCGCFSKNRSLFGWGVFTGLCLTRPLTSAMLVLGALKKHSASPQGELLGICVKPKALLFKAPLLLALLGVGSQIEPTLAYQLRPENGKLFPSWRTSGETGATQRSIHPT